MARVISKLPTPDGGTPPTEDRFDQNGAMQTMPGLCGVHATSSPPNPLPSLVQLGAAPQNGHEARSARADQGVVHPAVGSTQNDRLGGTASISFESERLAALAGTLGARLAGWKWSRTYNRWRSGESVNVFQRKMLAIMLARLRNTALDWEECARAKALPERKRK